MIHVSKDQLQHVEYLIDQSIQGNHVLFTADDLRKVFSRTGATIIPQAPSLSEEDAYAVEHHIERLILEPDLEKKRAFLDQLDPQTFALVVRTYFNIVENNLFETQQIRH